MQTTLNTALSFSGVGLHSGRAVSMRLLPAEIDHGISFLRTDVHDADPLIPATWDMVGDSRLCTHLYNDDGVGVSTVEHIMAALAGCGVHNALVEIDGPEVPILDGSAASFVSAILGAGLKDQRAPIKAIRILSDIGVTSGESMAKFSPADGFEIDYQIEFAEKAIGTQHKTLNMANGAFVRELCNSRTFCRQSDVQMMQEAGLVKGGTLENAVVFDGEDVISPGGVRHSDEPVRHKMLDAMGDLALAGYPILGRFTSVRGGHALTNKLLQCLFACPEAYEIVEIDDAMASNLPGRHVQKSDFAAVA